jgi:hypothetical protein
LDAFLQSRNEVRQTVKKDGPLPGILLMFLNFPNIPAVPGLWLR